MHPPILADVPIIDFVRQLLDLGGWGVCVLLVVAGLWALFRGHVVLKATYMEKAADNVALRKQVARLTADLTRERRRRRDDEPNA